MIHRFLNRITLTMVLLMAPVVASGQAAEEPMGISFGSWEKLCNSDDETRSSCRLIQLNKSASSGNTVMRTEIAVTPDGNLVVLVTVPLGLSLSDGPWLTVDGVYVSELRYDRCSANGCNAVARFGRFETSFLLNGERAVITLQPQEGVRVGVPILLDGLAEGYEAMLSVETPEN